jgi:hypothetical protein
MFLSSRRPDNGTHLSPFGIQTRPSMGLIELHSLVVVRHNFTRFGKVPFQRKLS